MVCSTCDRLSTIGGPSGNDDAPRTPRWPPIWPWRPRGELDPRRHRWVHGCRRQAWNGRPQRKDGRTA
eukprot:6319322-Alexandrium_andersonii.AAC.1